MLLPVSTQSAKQNQKFTLQLQATDSDGHAVSFSAAALPAGATIDPQTGLFTWTPSITQVGSFTVQFTATDGTLSSSQNVTINVAAAAVPPTFAATPPVLGKEGSTVTFTVSAGDLDGTSPTYTINGTLPDRVDIQPDNRSVHMDTEERPGRRVHAVVHGDQPVDRCDRF